MNFNPNKHELYLFNREKERREKRQKKEREKIDKRERGERQRRERERVRTALNEVAISEETPCMFLRNSMKAVSHRKMGL